MNLYLKKHRHACVTFRTGTHRLVLDPGSYSHDFRALPRTDIIIITHHHQDHFDLTKIAAIVARNPSVVIFSTPEVCALLPHHVKSVAITTPLSLQHKNWHLDFFPTQHIKTHRAIPAAANLAVRINHSVYYAGDSFFVPPVTVGVLLTPVAGSWMKVKEAMRFARTLRPSLLIATHDGILSDEGKKAVSKHFETVATNIKATYSAPKKTLLLTLKQPVENRTIAL